MREIVVDTETTGLDSRPVERGGTGDRIVEIACVELFNHIPTGRHFHKYINPERPMSADAFAIHGLSDEFLGGHPTFAKVVDDLLDFIGDAQLVIHNAEFDMRFINAELERLGRQPLAIERAVDTVQLARRRFPGARVSLDELCKRFAIDLSVREKHGALIDVTLLAEVYLELRGGRQPGFMLDSQAAAVTQVMGAVRGARPQRPMPLEHCPSPEETAAHQTLVASLNQPIWLRT
ncbi:MAG: DNA polymerase III subunit epsilon [Alphaproteobacteria bacterium]|nr:DNA polymerase III subunit epsilon [Alphaproteobacteria bacterium]